MKLSNVFCTVICMLAVTAASAQYHPAGNWLGMLDAGAMKLRIVFHVTESNGILKATMDSPDQGAKGIPVAQAAHVGDSITLSIGVASYSGRFINDSMIDGV